MQIKYPLLLKIIPLSILLSIPFIQATPPAKIKLEEVVFLLHGLGRTSTSMKRIEKTLLDEGYDVVNIDYRSKDFSIDDLTDRYISKKIISKSVGYKKCHFVTHSLGGIVMRNFFLKNKLDHVGRTVMISPPNGGSELADYLKGKPLMSKILGPTLAELGTHTKNSCPKSMGPYPYELGIITGDRSLNPFFSGIISGKDDGKVSVEEAKLEGMDDFIVVHSSHTFIMLRKSVVDQVAHFLQHGKFNHEKNEVK